MCAVVHGTEVVERVVKEMVGEKTTAEGHPVILKKNLVLRQGKRAEWGNSPSGQCPGRQT